MPTRSGDGFSFPIRKFDDGSGLYTNFKYLEQWLKGLGLGGASYAEVRLHENGQDNWTPGPVEWGRDDPAVVFDPDGILNGFSGTNDLYIHVAATGIYYVTSTVVAAALTDSASGLIFANWQTELFLVNNSGQTLQKSTDQGAVLADDDMNIFEPSGNCGQAFLVTDTVQKFFTGAGPVSSSQSYGTGLDPFFLDGESISAPQIPFTHMTFIKVA